MPFKSTAHTHSSLFGSYFYPPSLHSHFPLPSLSSSFFNTNPSTNLRRSTAPSSPEACINMLLGKRPRPPMKRTTSLSEIPFDLNVAPDAPQNDPNHNPNAQPSSDVIRKQPGGSNWSDQSVSPSNHIRHSVDFVETADFLRACFLCKRRLVSGRDIYMYRGDSAFCSLECRQQQMIQDERKEKRCMVSKRQVVAQPSESQVATKGESVAAL